MLINDYLDLSRHGLVFVGDLDFEFVVHFPTREPRKVHVLVSSRGVERSVSGVQFSLGGRLFV